MREQAADLLFRVEFPRDPVFRVVHRHRDTGTAAESIQRIVESVHGKSPALSFFITAAIARYSPYNCIIGDSKGVVKQKMTKNKDFTNSAKNSTTKSFLEEFQPQKAIISAGKNNLYGHPHKETIKKLQKNGADIYGTLWGGAIIIESDGQKYKINYFKRG